MAEQYRHEFMATVRVFGPDGSEAPWSPEHISCAAHTKDEFREKIMDSANGWDLRIGAVLDYGYLKPRAELIKIEAPE